MKSTSHLRNRVLRVNLAVCLALCFAAGMGMAGAATITSPFVQQGSLVTTPGASGTYSPAPQFQDSANTYTVLISPAYGQTATLNNNSTAVVYVGNGSTITVSSGITINESSANPALLINDSGVVNNGGTVTASANSGNAVAITGIGIVNNSGTLISSSPNGGTAVNLVESGGSVSNLGTIAGGDNGIVFGAPGVTSAGTLTNFGTILGVNGFGVLVTGQGLVTLAGGTVSGDFAAIDVNIYGGPASTVTVLGRTSLTGSIVSATALSTLNLNLVGLTPAELANLKTTVNTANTTTHDGMFTVGTHTYSWNGFTVNDNAISLELVVDSGLVNAAKAIDNTSQGLPAAYDPFYVAAAGNPEAAVNELVGREINQGLDILGVNMSTTFNSDLNEHLDNILTGGQLGGIDLGGLHVGEAGSLYAMGDTTSQLEAIMHMTGPSAFGGTEMSTDSKAMVSAPPPPAWGLWAAGNVTLGDESGANTLSGFHSTLGSPVLGLDYRVCPSLVLGITGSYTTGDANFGDGSKIGVNADLLALYGTWRSGNWHVNGIAGGGLTQFNDNRTTFSGLTANSNPRGYDVLTDWTVGYDFHLGDRWNITPEAGLQYTHLDIDSFSETGAGVFDLAEGNQDIDSLRTHVGFRTDKAFNLGPDLTFTPELRAYWYHECLDDSRGISTSLPGAPALGSFSVNTFSPQRDFALVGAGLNTAYTGYKGIPIGLFLNYDAQVGQSDYISNSVNAGIRVDF